MLSILLSVWGIALLMTACCWSVGSALTSSEHPLVRMLAGWCGFFLLCTVPWITGISAHQARPLFWLFFAAGVLLAFRRARWNDLAAALACATTASAMVLLPFLLIPGLLAYGAHGLDAWGYILAADWLRDHGIRELPVIGTAPMRFNWTWYVLNIRERPLIYESMACLSSATGAAPDRIYLAFAAALMASVAAALARAHRLFRIRLWPWAIPPALILAAHPIVTLPWIAGYFAGAVASLCVALALAAASVPTAEQSTISFLHLPAHRAEAWAFATLMLVLCAGLYAKSFLAVALAVGAAPIALAGVVALARHELAPLRRIRPTPRVAIIVGIILLAAAAVLSLAGDFKSDIGLPQSVAAAANQVLALFGGSSPYLWLGYDPHTPKTLSVLADPVGCACVVITAFVLVAVARQRWRAHRDLSLVLLAGLCVGTFVLAAHNDVFTAKSVSVFGFSLLMIMAVASCELPRRWMGSAALIVCCMAPWRDFHETRQLFTGPFIQTTQENVSHIEEDQFWRFLSYLYFRADDPEVDWSKYPNTYAAMTCFLPEDDQRKLRLKYFPSSQ